MDWEVTPGTHDATPTVRTRGQGVVEVEPDMATINVGVQIDRPNLAAARDEAASRASAIVSAIKGVGVPTRDIRTSGFYVDIVRDTRREGKPTVILGYVVWNRITVTVRILDLLPAVIDGTIAAGANDLDGPAFFVQEPEPLHDEARRRAMASARQRAETLASSEGLTLGRVRSINDSGGESGYSRYSRFRTESRYSLAESAVSTPIESGAGLIMASVDVVWELV